MTATILLIDDDKDITYLLGRCLNKYGYDVITSNHSGEGVQLARDHDPKTIIMDLMMPEMDGWQVCREIRSFSNVPIIIFSALSEANTITSALDAGADYFLVKPVSITTIVAYLRNAINCSGRARSLMSKVC